MLSKLRSIGLLLIACMVLPCMSRVNAQTSTGSYRYSANEEQLGQQSPGTLLSAFPEDEAAYLLSDPFRVLTVIGQSGLRGPQFESTYFRLGDGPLTFTDSRTAYDPVLGTPSSANYVRLDRAANSLGFNRRNGTIVRIPFGTSTVQVMPSPPGSVTLPDTQQHWPFLALSAGRPLATSEYTFTVQTDHGLYQYSYITKQYYLLEPSPSAAAFAVADRGYIAGNDGGHSGQATVWYYGQKQHFDGLYGVNKALGVNESGITVGYSNYRGPGPQIYQAWIGQYGSSATKPIIGMDIALSVNNSGQVIGLKYVSGDPSLAASYEGMLYETFTSKTVSLRSLYPTGAAMSNVQPTAIDDRGNISFYAKRNGQPVSGTLRPARTINVWDVKDNVGVPRASNQIFRFSLGNSNATGDAPATGYVGSFAFNGNFSAASNPQNTMQTGYGSGTSYKAYYVDLFSLPYYGGTYPDDKTVYVTYLAKDLAGNVLAVDTHRIYLY